MIALVMALLLKIAQKLTRKPNTQAVQWRLVKEMESKQ